MKIWSKIIVFCSAMWSIAEACEQPEYRQFDFWLGEWKVFTKEGELAGENKINLGMKGCAIKESYSTPIGYSGESLNIFDQTRGVWHQTWVDSGGLLLSLEGAWDGKKMSLSGPGFNREKQPITHRIQWTPQDNGEVHQHWETSKEGSDNWVTVFYGIYKKQ